MSTAPKEQLESADAMLVSMSIADAPVSVVPVIPPTSDGLLKKLASKGAWALADQAVVSIGNFVTVILVLRNLTNASEVGAFQNLLEVLLFLNGLQQALIIYPMLVRGASLGEAAMQRLASGCLIATSVLCVPLAIGMLGTSVALYVFGKSVHFAAAPLFLWTPLALIFQQLQELVRRAMIAHLRFAAVIPGDAISYVGQAVLLLALGHRLTLPITFAVMAVTSALAATVQAFQLGLRRFPLSELKALMIDFWSLSRWVLFANLGSLVTGNSYTWLLTFTWGLAPSGYFGIIANLAKPVNPLTTAISGLIIPSVARARAGGGTRFAMQVGLRYAFLGGAALAVYFGVLELFPGACLHLMYKKTFSPELPNYLRVLVCSWTLLFITSMVVAILNGLGYSRVNFLTTLANAIVTVCVSLPLVYSLGLKGTIIGGLLATAAATIVAVYSFIRHHNDAPGAPGAPSEPSVVAAPT